MWVCIFVRNEVPWPEPRNLGPNGPFSKRRAGCLLGLSKQAQFILSQLSFSNQFEISKYTHGKHDQYVKINISKRRR